MNYSIIIPTHNIPDLLQRLLDSIPVRDDVEVIIVDDNSDPNIVDFDHFPGQDRPNTKIIFNKEPGRGAGYARNLGLKAATGKWLLFADSDDYYVEGFLDVLDKYINEPIDVVYFNYSFIDSATKECFPDNQLQKYLGSYQGAKEQGDYIKFKNNMPWDKLVRMEYIKSHKMYFEEVKNGNDVLFSLFVASYCERFAIESARLYYYVRTPNSIGTKRQSIAELQCRIDHMIKHSYFNKMNGHPEWNGSLCKYLVSLCKQYGKKAFLQLPPRTGINSFLKRDFKKEWVQIIENHK